MKIGIAASTLFEIQPTIDFLKENGFACGPDIFETVITGIGSMAACYHVADFIFSNKPDYMIQAGICGSFTDKFPTGKVILIKEEALGDLGVEEQNGFQDIFDLGLASPSLEPFSNRGLPNPSFSSFEKYDVPGANGITVNEISTQPNRIKLLVRKYNCETESMEGAAFHYVCLQKKVPFMQIRAVSNTVGERDKSKWKLREAIENLNNKLIEIIQHLR